MIDWMVGEGASRSRSVVLSGIDVLGVTPNKPGKTRSRSVMGCRSRGSLRRCLERALFGNLDGDS